MNVVPGGTVEEPAEGERWVRSARRRGVAGFVAAVVVSVSAVVLVLPDLLFGLDRRTPFAQLVWLRPYLLVPLSVALLVLGVLAARRRRVLLPTVVVLVVVVVVVVVGAVLVVPRFVPTAVPAGGRLITVVAFNTFNGAAAVDEVAALLREERPDVVALVEAGESFRSRLAPLVEPDGYRLITQTGRAGNDDVKRSPSCTAPGLLPPSMTNLRCTAHRRAAASQTWVAGPVDHDMSSGRLCGVLGQPCELAALRARRTTTGESGSGHGVVVVRHPPT